jgi:hypothetical protein
LAEGSRDPLPVRVRDAFAPTQLDDAVGVEARVDPWVAFERFAFVMTLAHVPNARGEAIGNVAWRCQSNHLSEGGDDVRAGASFDRTKSNGDDSRLSMRVHELHERVLIDGLHSATRTGPRATPRGAPGRCVFREEPEPTGPGSLAIEPAMRIRSTGLTTHHHAIGG